MRRFIPFFLLLFITFLPACREQTKEEIYMQGMTFVQAGNYQGAISFFKSALDKDPNYIDARFQLGIAYQETEKLDKGEKEFGKVLRQQPSRHEASLHLAQIYINTERVDKAIQILKEIEKYRSSDVEVFSLMGQCYKILGEYETSENKYNKALAIQPTHLNSQLGLAQVLFVTERTSDAQKLIQKAIETHPKKSEPYYLKFKYALKIGNVYDAIESLKQIQLFSPEDINASYLLALLYIDVGDLEKSHAIADKLKTGHSEHAAGSRILGVYFYMMGDYDTALEELQQSIKRLPDMSGYYFTGLVYYRLNRYEQALSSFQTALDKNPDHEGSRLMVAQTLLKQGRLEDCQREVQKVLAVNTESGQAHNLLGSVYLAQGQYDLALKELDTAIEVDPSLASAYLKKGLFNLATGNSSQGVVDLQNSVATAPEILNTRLLLAKYYLKQHNYPMALKVLNEGLNGSSGNALIYNYMAAAYIAQNKQKEVVESLQKAKIAKPDYLAPYVNLANFYVTLGETQAAIDELISAVVVAPDNLQIHLKLASLYELTGDVVKAEEHYNLSHKLDKDAGYIAYAAFFERSGQKEKSIELLRTAYAKHPDNLILIGALGKALQNVEQYDEAIKIYMQMEEIFPGKGLPLLVEAQLQKGDFAAANETALRAINVNPKEDYGYLLLSSIHEFRQEWSLAENVVKHAMKLNNESIEIKMSLANIYAAQARYKEAQSIYDNILLKDPDFIPALFCKGAIYDFLGVKRQAQDLYKHIIEIDENYTPALNNLAYLTLEVYADKEKALKLAAKAFRNSPDNARVMDTLGYALLQNGEVEKSITFLEKAVRLMPKENSIHVHLAQAYKTVGRNDDAVTSLNKVNTNTTREVQFLEPKTLLNELN